MNKFDIDYWELVISEIHRGGDAGTDPLTYHQNTGNNNTQYCATTHKAILKLKNSIVGGFLWGDTATPLVEMLNKSFGTDAVEINRPSLSISIDFII